MVGVPICDSNIEVTYLNFFFIYVPRVEIKFTGLHMYNVKCTSICIPVLMALKVVLSGFALHRYLVLAFSGESYRSSARRIGKLIDQTPSCS